MLNRAVTKTILAGLLAVGLAPAAQAAPATYEPNTVIVKYRGGVSSAERSLVGRTAGLLERIARVRGTGALVMRVAGDSARVAARLSRSPRVRYAEPNYLVRAAAFPNDTRFSQQYALHNTGQSGGLPDADIDGPEGWDAAGLSAFPAAGGAKIGIIDSGVQAGHEDLAGKVHDCAGVNSFGLNLIVLSLFADPTIVPGKCADDNGHGTHVAGIAGATANNSRGVAGVAFNSPLAVCKALDAGGTGSVAGVANCLGYLNSRGARVISMSLSTTANSATLANAVRTANANGSLLVAAAGNSGNQAVNYPAGYPEVVAVGATDRRDNKASFSNFNSDVEVVAPGVDIHSTWNDGGYNSASGTSMATPHAAAVAAVIAGQAPSAGVSAWRSRLQQSVDDLGPAGRDPQFGFGRVNLVKAAG